MTTRRRISETERAAIFLRAEGRCHICGEEIDGTRQRWDVEHVIPLEMGGDEAKGSDNLQPAHCSCHIRKTRDDVGKLAKAKRQERRSMGIRRTVKSPLPGSRGSKWKRRMDGTVVRRDEEQD